MWNIRQVADSLRMLQKYDNFLVHTKRAKTSTLQAFNALPYDRERISA
jgi:hypothetical protein